jgi:hypothetical protein
MPETAWLPAAQLPPVPGAPPSKVAPIYDLRPLTLGEVLDRTFSVYRSRFWLFAGISAFSAGVQLLGSGVQMASTYLLRSHITPRALGELAIGFMIVIIVAYMLAFSITQAATVYAVGEVYLNRNTSIMASLRATIHRWYIYVGIAFWQIGSVVWLPLLAFALFAGSAFLLRHNMVAVGIIGILLFLVAIGAYVMGFIFYLRNLLAVPSTVIEHLKLRATMRRSKVLAAGAKGRIFLTMLVAGALFMVAFMLLIPLGMLISIAHVRGVELVLTQAATMLVMFLGYSLVSPVLMIGLTLIYFDQRVRKEAFDIAILLGEPITPEPSITEPHIPAPPPPLPTNYTTAEPINPPHSDAPAL